MPVGTAQKHITIGELALRAGVGVETIRFYERKGLIGAARGSGRSPMKTIDLTFRACTAEAVRTP